MGSLISAFFSELHLEKKDVKISSIFSIIGILLFFTAPDNFAIPSFARQTNLSCNYCHYTYPALTSFGRMFKLNGYTLMNAETIESVSSDSEHTTLKIPSTFPFSAFVKSSFTSISKGAPGIDKSFVQSPEELSLFVSGEISPKIGGFVQLTYGLSDGAIGLDMLDLRYADHTLLGSKELIYGLTLNSMPSEQDVWNTTPVWGFPYYGSEFAPSPSAATLIQSMEGVAGLGAYALYDKLIYAEVAGYRSSPAGVSYPPDNSWERNIKGVSPYWRLALQHQWKSQYLEVGTYGLSSSIYPAGVTGSTDKYTDIGFDAQFECTGDNNSSWIFHTTYITEQQNLDATFNDEGSANASDKLNYFKIDGTYNFPEFASLTAGFFSASGSNDMVLYAPGDISGSANGDPNSSGEILQVTFTPWMNTQIGVQYTLYNKFNGASSNYDGSGRNASDNNTLYVMTWLVF
jgi:hypothetical protein